ncbi:hypothetical protein Tco_0115002 [Tanacetum coccineum]
MWLFKHNHFADRYLSKYNARLVANGNSEQLGVDYDETFSLVVKTCYYSYHSQSCFYSALACSSTGCQDCHSTWYMERISKKRTKNEAKTTKPDTEWKSVEKTKSSQSPSLKKSTKVNPDKSKVKKVKKNKFGG